MGAGYSGTSLARKLGIKDGHRVLLVGAPESMEDLLSPLPSGANVERCGVFVPEGDGGGEASTLPDPSEGRYDVILLFCRDASSLRRSFGPTVSRLRWAGGLWACWPKKSSGLYRDLAREEVREVGLGTGLVDNKVCAVDEDWSGLRFVVRTDDRPDDTDEGGPAA